MYEGVGSSHNIVINEETEYAYIVGVSSGASVCGDGGLHILDIKDPKNPEYVACFDEDGYTHDAQCITYNGPDTDYAGKEICFNSNEDTFTIVDVNDKNNMSMISRTSYDNFEYTHQGWLTEDHRFFLMNDEEDELKGHSSHPRTLIWNVENLDEPVLIGNFYNEAVSIDHNLYIKGDLIFESNYSSGLRILSSERVAEGMLREVAFFDTEPSIDAINFTGSRSNYPYFESGSIAVSDINSGLFILSLDISEVITEHPQDVAICEGTFNNFSVMVNGSAGLTYQWQIEENNGFVDLVNGDGIAGVQSPDLILKIEKSHDGIGVRAKITEADGSVHLTYPAPITLTNTFPEAAFDTSLDGTTVSFVNNSVNADSYFWDFGDGNTSTEVSPTHTYQNISNIDVKLTATNSCGDVTHTEGLFVIASSEELSQDWLIYPSPVTDFLTLELPESAQFRIHDLTGREIMKGFLKNNIKSRIDLRSISEGHYIISIQTREEVHSTVLLKK